MKITLTGSLGNISKQLVAILTAAGHTVTVISSDPHKAAAIQELGAIAAIGSIEDVHFLTQAFAGADAVYTMVPPIFTPSDWKSYIAGIGKNYAMAIQQSGVKNVVNLSSMGAHLAEGAGPVSGLHRVEETLNQLDGVNILHLRPGYFYTNFYTSADMIKNMGILGGNNGGDTVLVMADPADIAKAAAIAIQELSFKGKSIHYVVSDARTANEVAEVIGRAVNKPNLPWVEFTDEQLKDGMMKSGLPEEIAANYVEMGSAVRNGKLFEDFKGVPNGTKLEDFAKVFAETY